MSEIAQIVLLAIAVVALYVISSKWQPSEPSFLGMRASFWIGLAAAFLAAMLIVLTKLKLL